MYFSRLTHCPFPSSLVVYLSTAKFRGKGLQAWKIQMTTTIESNDARLRLLQWCTDLWTCMIHFWILLTLFYEVFVNFSVLIYIYKTHTCTHIHFVFVSDPKDPLTPFCSLIGSGITAFKSTYWPDWVRKIKYFSNARFSMSGILFISKIVHLSKFILSLCLSTSYRSVITSWHASSMQIECQEILKLCSL